MFGYYINRKDKPDRLNHLKTNILNKPFFSNLQRFEAIVEDNGRIGCSKSHIQCLKQLQNREEKYFLMIEDDIAIKNNHFNNFVKDFDKIKDKQWDMIVLGGTVCTGEFSLFENFYRLLFSYTTTGYIVKKSYIPTLLENFKKSLEMLIKTNDRLYYLDVYWNILQKRDKWYVYSKSFISQLHDYSTTEEKETNYDKLFATYYLNVMNKTISFDATK